MEPILMANAFATIVGLLSDFKSEHRDTTTDEKKEFMNWLSKNNYNHIIDEISSNNQLSLGIKSFLNQSHESIMKELSVLNESLILISSKLRGFSYISHAIAPKTEISSQAISIISQLNESSGSHFIEIKISDGTIFQIVDASEEIKIQEPRFVSDDLNQLVSLGLLMLEFTSKGYRLFRITRYTVKFLQQIYN